jgi:hypothetical protein
MAVEDLTGTTGSVTDASGYTWPGEYLCTAAYHDLATDRDLCDLESTDPAQGMVYGRLSYDTHQPLGPVPVTWPHARLAAPRTPSSWFQPNPPPIP